MSKFQEKEQEDTKSSTRGKGNKNNSKKRMGGGTPRSSRKFSGNNGDRDYRDNMCNDPKWYIPTDQNLKDVATFSFNHPAGYKNNNHDIYPRYEQGSFYTPDRTHTIPGVATMRLMPTIGVANDETAAVNIAATNMYSAIRRANSGSKNYDAPDLMQVVLAVGQAYSYVSWLFRLYGYTNVYSSQNSYIPRALVEANGVDWNSIASNQNDFRARINQLVLQINAINVPKNLPIFDRWYHIYEKCYADSSTPQAQIYQAAPRGFLIREETTGTLKYTELPFFKTYNYMTYKDLIEFGTNMINGLLYSEDVGTISGDVLKAFGDGGIYRLPIIPEDYAVIPTLSDEIRSQFENAVILPYNGTETTYSIVQDSSKAYLKSDLAFIMDQEFVAPARSKALNFHKSDVNSEDVIVATRWIPGIVECRYRPEVKDKYAVVFSSYGSEIAVDLIITTTAIQKDGSITLSDTHVGSGVNLTFYSTSLAPNVMAYAVGIMSQVSAFDWFPEVGWFLQKSNPATGDYVEDNVYYLGSILDWDRYYILAQSNIDDLNNTAILGLFGVPNL